MNELSSQIHEILNYLRRHKWTLGFAESCTGGLLSSLVTRESGVSDVFMGAVVSYANSVKEKVLSVRSSSLQNEGAVSELVALEMAKGVCKNLNVDVSVAITGVAGPTGGSPQKPVGFVCFAICGPNFERVFHHQFSGTRNEIQKASAQKALSVLLDLLKKEI